MTSPCWAAQAGVELYQFDGTQADESFGNSIASAGDVNLDGFADFVVGSANHVDANGKATGAVSIYSGIDGHLRHRLTGFNSDGALFGAGVAGMGDLNGDGRADIVVSAPGRGTVGSGYFISASSGDILRQFELVGPVRLGADVANAGDLDRDGVDDAIFGSSTGPNAAGRISVISGRSGLQMRALQGEVGERFGAAVGGAGDVNLDGYDDFIVSIPNSSVGSGTTNNGEVRVYSGRDTSILHAWFGVDNEYMGNDVAGAGDVNGDGHGDVLVCSSRASVGLDLNGRVTLYSGLDGTVIYEWIGENHYDRFGTSAASAGDVNRDGIPDIVIGMESAEPNGLSSAGRVFIMNGADGSVIANWNGSNADMAFGSSVAGAGDVNNDGFDDVLIAATGNDVGGIPAVGSVFVRSGGWAGVPELKLIQVEAGKRILLSVEGCTTLDEAVVAWSLAGPGPTQTPFGSAFVSAPFTSRRVPLNPLGEGSLFESRLPISSTGMPIWFHGVDIASGLSMDPIATTVN